MKKTGYKANRKPFYEVMKEIEAAQRVAGLKTMERQKTKNQERIDKGLPPKEYKYVYGKPVDPETPFELTKEEAENFFTFIPWDMNLGESVDTEAVEKQLKENMDYAQLKRDEKKQCY